MTLELASDGGHREGQEVPTLLGAEPSGGGDESGERHLLEILARDALVPVRGGEGTGHVEVGQDDLTWHWRYVSGSAESVLGMLSLCD